MFEGQRNGGLAVGTKQQHKSEKSIKNSWNRITKPQSQKFTKLETVANNNKAQNTITNLQPEIKDLETESQNLKQNHTIQNRNTSRAKTESLTKLKTEYRNIFPKTLRIALKLKMETKNPKHGDKK